jgi:hypothetical protein
LTGVEAGRSGACPAAAAATVALTGADSETGVAPVSGRSASSDVEAGSDAGAGADVVVLTSAGAGAVVFAGTFSGVAVADCFAVVCANAAPGSANQRIAVRGASRFMLFT